MTRTTICDKSITVNLGENRPRIRDREILMNVKSMAKFAIGGKVDWQLTLGGEEVLLRDSTKMLEVDDTKCP
jgi:hypothetical protein